MNLIAFSRSRNCVNTQPYLELWNFSFQFLFHFPFYDVYRVCNAAFKRDLNLLLCWYGFRDVNVTVKRWDSLAESVMFLWLSCQRNDL